MAPSPSHPPRWTLEHETPLAGRTSFGTGGTARIAAHLEDNAYLPELLAWAKAEGHVPLILGQGTNVLISDAGIDQLVIWLDDKKTHVETFEDRTVLHHGSGVALADSVALATSQGFYDMAALAGIPGTIGAAPVQNVGAYGQAIGDVLRSVDVIRLSDGVAMTLSSDALGLDYRHSHFKDAWRDTHAIVAVRLELTQRHCPKLAHRELQEQIEGLGRAVSPENVRQSVMGLRRQKGMLWPPDDALMGLGHAGSFFTNPVVPRQQAESLRQQKPSLPLWQQGEQAKVSAAYLIESAGFARGFRAPEVDGRVGLSPRHALALANFGGASTHDIVQVATRIQRQVFNDSGIWLTPEPRLLGFSTQDPLAFSVTGDV